MTRFLFVPNLDSRRGWGHWRRCVEVAGALGPARCAVLALRLDRLGRLAFDRTEGVPSASGVRLVEVFPDPGDFDVIVVDQQSCPTDTLVRLKSLRAFLVGWDEGGRHRSHFDYLVDSLPNLAKTPPNILQPSLAGAVRCKEGFSAKVKSVLVAFGGGDPSGLTVPTLKLLRSAGWIGAADSSLRVVAVRGPGASFKSPFPEVEVWDAPENLASRLQDFDLVLGSWGLTAIEALSRGISFLAAAPSFYHARLGRRLGLAAFRPNSLSSFKKAWPKSAEASRRVASGFPETGPDASTFWSTFRVPGEFTVSACPVCSRRNNPCIARTTSKTYFRCRSCGMEYLVPFQTPAKVYSEVYFFEEYQRQYGKTYLEDFNAIKKTGSERIAFAERLWGAWAGRKVLDVGCAYGPFLAAAADVGARPFGVDVSPSAVTYVRESLGFPAQVAAFPESRWEDLFETESRPDFLTMWYVIEHFARLEPVLKRVSEILPGGGGFAFSTPNGKGISRRFSTQKFWEQSPDDHFSIWNPSNVRRVLKRFGFRVDAIRITGHHPERFPGVSGPADWRWRWIVGLDRGLGWGDTFEVFARKL